ncbi:MULTISPECIES: hypothetical protein [unclassified Flavobacterium]|uniref:hypothetical protein n=1 Tax=unclassified Flavobacterium TaxID=196869 RepID=UPI001F12A3C9|nr:MULTISPECIES: hypothetical protein [unclassified Flavobacterium]UMY64354.1 hypothetical protein MKO97_07485 [Flavobacterium sp. HJ-32-4]
MIPLILHQSNKVTHKERKMPLVTAATLAVLYPFLTELGKKGIEKVVDTSSEKLTEGTISWIKALFFKDNKPKNVLQKLVENPNKVENQNAIKTLIENSIEDNPEVKNFIAEIAEKFPHIHNSITNSKNVITGNVNTGGGNFVNGDGNQIS